MSIITRILRALPLSSEFKLSSIDLLFCMHSLCFESIRDWSPTQRREGQGTKFGPRTGKRKRAVVEILGEEENNAQYEDIRIRQRLVVRGDRWRDAHQSKNKVPQQGIAN